uniref:Uncharacterized protein n=1 Tax=Vibrio fluvialis TaxID=676 RepID=C9E5M7_VIBFL|nr:hypothetical protein ICEVFLIND1_0005 [Vibrio fluvialis Ind1]
MAHPDSRTNPITAIGNRNHFTHHTPVGFRIKKGANNAPFIARFYYEK